jgi:hypothetical protein
MNRQFSRNACRLLLASVLCLAGSSAFADPPEGKGRNKHKNAESSGDYSASATTALVTAGISASVARQLAIDSGINMSGYKPLPPGIQKNLARGKPLPPGIARKAAPSGMIPRLPKHPGYEWQMAGTDLVLVQIGTSIVSDVLKDVFR